MVYVMMLQVVISSVCSINNMLYVRRGNINKVVMNFLENGSSLNEPGCLEDC